MAPDHNEARQALIEALVATGHKDRAAFLRVYRLTSAKLFGICLRICGERAAAEEVLQDVYMLVWERSSTFELGRASPITWLATIARNRAIDWLRANPSSATKNVDEIADIPSDTPSARDAMLIDEAHRRLQVCLETLEGAQREAIRAAFFGGRTYSQLAEVRAVPLGTMKSWIRRGLLRLRGCLEDST